MTTTSSSPAGWRSHDVQSCHPIMRQAGPPRRLRRVRRRRGQGPLSTGARIGVARAPSPGARASWTSRRGRRSSVESRRIPAAPPTRGRGRCGGGARGGARAPASRGARPRRSPMTRRAERLTEPAAEHGLQQRDGLRRDRDATPVLVAQQTTLVGIERDERPVDAARDAPLDVRPEPLQRERLEEEARHDERRGPRLERREARRAASGRDAGWARARVRAGRRPRASTPHARRARGRRGSRGSGRRSRPG